MAKKKAVSEFVSPDNIHQSIHLIRGQRVMLDSDLAKLYGVPTFRLNEQVARNRKRFPIDFAFQLTRQEVAILISQFAISSSGHGGRRSLPWVFTEHGVAMLSSVLNSETAIEVNIQIMRAFTRLRRLLSTPGELVTQLNQLADTVQLHDEQIKVITDVLKKMMEPPPSDPLPKRRIGFQVPDVEPTELRPGAPSS
jgi:hypothetical protein